jgi:hypothetical protein
VEWDAVGLLALGLAVVLAVGGGYLLRDGVVLPDLGEATRADRWVLDRGEPRYPDDAPGSWTPGCPAGHHPWA